MKKKFIAIILMILSLSAAVTFFACDTTTSNEDVTNPIDLFVFMGQSNMGGRGEAAETVPCGSGHGYEFRAVTDPTKLYPVAEPFGEKENNSGINDNQSSGLAPKKTGGLTSAFCEAYFESTGVPVLAVSASQGGTASDRWIPYESDSLVTEAQNRLFAALSYMDTQSEFTVRHINMVWLQGESDAGKNISEEKYAENLTSIINVMKAAGVEKCFVITIGSYINNPANQVKYRAMAENQIRYCENNNDAVLASKKLMDMPEPLMHLNNHFHQGAYNVTGYDAGKNAASYLTTGVAPVCTNYVLGEEITLARKYGVSLTYHT